MAKVVTGKKSPYENKPKTKTVLTHVNKVIPNGATDNSSWIDLDGYNTLALLFKNETGAHNHTGYLDWSNDGVNKLVSVATLATGTAQERVGTSPAYARYVRVGINNAHTAPVTVNASLYLKP